MRQTIVFSKRHILYYNNDGWMNIDSLVMDSLINEATLIWFDIITVLRQVCYYLTHTLFLSHTHTHTSIHTHSLSLYQYVFKKVKTLHNLGQGMEVIDGRGGYLLHCVLK